jgi:hypothetical protein
MSNDQQGTPRPDDETQPVRPEGAAPLPAPPDPGTPAPAASEAQTSDPVARRGFRERLGRLRRTEGGDRSYGLAALIASALAGVIVGGLGLTAVHAVTHDGPGDRGAWVERRDERGPGIGGQLGGRGGMHGRPPGMPGQVQPTTPPDDEDSSS